MRTRAEVPFKFSGCAEFRRMLGERAEDEKELADLLEQVSLDSVFYHTYGSLLRDRHRTGLYSNDFATWVAIQVRDRVLGEHLAVLDPLDFETLADLRDEIISVIDNHLKSMAVIPRIVYGEPFDFVESRVLEVPTGVDAYSLDEFRKALSDLDDSAIYYHTLEARVRLEHGQDDFSAWLRDHLDLPGLGAKFRSLNPYIGGLERVRSQMLDSCDRVLARGRDL